MSRLMACCLAGLILAGCSTAPVYERPEVAQPDGWRWKVAEPRDRVPRGEWWKVFQDPALDVLQAEASVRNQDLQAAMARAEQARSLARMSRADSLPSVAGSGSWARYRTSGNAPSPVPFPVPSFTQQQWTTPLDLSYEVDLWGRVRGSFQSARQQALAAESAQESLRLMVQAEVAKFYFDLQNSQAEVRVLELTVRLRQEAMEIFDQRFEAGLIGDYEIQRGRVEVAGAEAELQAARRRQAEILNGLALLCGRTASGFAPEPSTNTLLPVIAAGLPSALLERRPDVAQAERELASRLADLGVAKVASYPSLKLTGTGGFLSGEVKNLFEWDSRTWGLGPSLSIPIFQGGRNRANQAKAKAAYEEGVARFRQRVLEAFRDVEDSLAAIQFLAEEASARGRAADAARTSARIALSRYQAGSINFLDVVTAENARLGAELARVRVEHEQRLATVRLIKALGGGWE
jgi:multidrug efflux system outer membrane protein